MDPLRERWQIVGLHGAITFILWIAAVAALFTYDHSEGTKALGLALIMLTIHSWVSLMRLENIHHERVALLEYHVKNLREVLQQGGSPAELVPLLPVQTNKT
jgi:apolipoprotein N-acyltransferase